MLSRKENEDISSKSFLIFIANFLQFTLHRFIPVYSPASGPADSGFLRGLFC